MDFIKGLSKFDKVNVAGLMTMAPLTDDEQVLRECFRKLKGIH